MNAYLYSLSKDGDVVERAVILSRKRGSDYADELVWMAKKMMEDQQE